MVQLLRGLALVWLCLLQLTTAIDVDWESTGTVPFLRQANLNFHGEAGVS